MTDDRPYKSQRLSPGNYRVSGNGRTVMVCCNEYWDGPGWVAAAEWDNTRYSDPMDTKREAMTVALNMLYTEL